LKPISDKASLAGPCYCNREKNAQKPLPVIEPFLNCFRHRVNLASVENGAMEVSLLAKRHNEAGNGSG
jgi:hypothetical protein